MVDPAQWPPAFHGIARSLGRSDLFGQGTQPSTVSITGKAGSALYIAVDHFDHGMVRECCNLQTPTKKVMPRVGGNAEGGRDSTPAAIREDNHLVFPQEVEGMLAGITCVSEKPRRPRCCDFGGSVQSHISAECAHTISGQSANRSSIYELGIELILDRLKPCRLITRWHSIRTRNLLYTLCECSVTLNSRSNHRLAEPSCSRYGFCDLFVDRAAVALDE